MAGKGKGFRIFANIVLVILTLSAVLPFILLIMSSVTHEDAIMRYGYSFIPREFSGAAYRYLMLSSKRILKAYGMTFLVTSVGTVLSTFITIFVAYLLSKKDLPGRKFLTFVVFFTMLFSGGMIPTYLVWSQLMHVRDTVWGLICPNLLMSAFNVILIRTYFTSNVPMEICEAAEMDSCSQPRMLFAVYLPLSKPMIATISLFSALGYWNDWINGLYYISVKRDLYTIQNVLNAMQSSIQFLKDNASAGMTEFAMNLPSMGVRMAIAVIAVLPIMAIYPFFQKSFVRGIVIGGVKG
ncbi:MAG: carbohydrate ABC transporter permease [Lachnospiraceae bacterium]|nr:carbohydrate ABC transporter permease [Lachnospiraceae bacterium]